MIIDAHAHIYPDKIALKASKSIQSFYDLNVDHDGSVGRLLELGKAAGISYHLVHSVATTPEQVTRINDFIIDEVNLHNDRFVGFCTLHPDFINPGKEIDRILAAGLKGIKLHPDFQRFNLDDERAYGIYEAAEGRLPILTHMGDPRYDFSKAERLYRVIERFPRLTFIGAHLGSYSDWDGAADILQGTGIYVDTSSSLAFLSPEKVRSLIDVYGADKVLFACDYPMWTPSEEIERLNKVPLSLEERRMIMCDNAAKLLGLPLT